MFYSFSLSYLLPSIIIVCLAQKKFSPSLAVSNSDDLNLIEQDLNEFELYNPCQTSYHQSIKFKIFENDSDHSENSAEIYQYFDIHNTFNLLWNYNLPKSQSMIKIFRTQPQQSTQNCPLEYQFVWKNLYKFNTKKIICFDYSTSQWFPTYLGKFPLPARNVSSPPYRVPFVTGPLWSADVGPMIEYLFLSANGFAIALDPLHPWYLESAIGENEDEPQEFCFSIIPKRAKEDPNSPFPEETEIQHANKYYALKFRILAGKDIATVYREAVTRYISRPITVPADLLPTEEPMWLMKVNSSKIETIEKSIQAFDISIRQFFTEVYDNSFSRKKIVDEHWQSFEGDFAFDENRYSNISKFFIRSFPDIKFAFSIGLQINSRSANYNESLPYLVKNINNDIYDDADNRSHMIDISDSQSRKWFSNKLKTLKATSGIGSFIFQRGDVIDFMQNGCTSKNQRAQKRMPFYDPLIRKYPNFLTTNYVATVSRMSKNIVVSAAHVSQQFPIFTRFSVRMLNHTDIKKMISDMLTLSLAGYPFVMPVLDDETLQQQWTLDLYLRYTQLLAFLPAMNMEILPWDLSIDANKYAAKLSQLITDTRRMLMPIWRNATEQWIKSGDPVIRPMWYATHSYRIDDQFMIGDQLVVAPVAEAGRSVRDVWLTRGKWINHRTETETVTEDIRWVRDVPASMDEIVYFIKDYQ